MGVASKSDGGVAVAQQLEARCHCWRGFVGLLVSLRVSSFKLGSAPKP